MLKIGITGQSGFVGTHLYNSLGLHPEEFERVPFNKDYFFNQQQLEQFVSQCDVIVHLASINRHNDPQVIFETNIELAQKLVDALEFTKSKAHVLFSSSTQEVRDNEYGNSKRIARELCSAAEVQLLLQRHGLSVFDRGICERGLARERSFNCFRAHSLLFLLMSSVTPFVAPAGGFSMGVAAPANDVQDMAL